MTGVDAGLAPIRALVSIHDVMPETLDRVRGLLARCAHINPGPVTLLVVPGRAWDAAGIDQLRAWQAAGHSLAGHGWLHRVERFGGLAHRMHGLLLSRRVAEHLALDAPEVAALVRRCHAWFESNGLAPAELYVPPAWAMGRLAPGAIAALPFAQYETLIGVREAATGRLWRIPMLGYEADTRLRAPAVRLWNAWNRRRALRVRWLRIAIHPGDPDLHLGEDLHADLRRYPVWTTYGELGQRAPDADAGAPHLNPASGRTRHRATVG